MTSQPPEEDESFDSILRDVARAPAIEPTRCAPGDRIGPYEIRAFIGAGAMGQVYRGWDPRLGRDVAIKMMSRTDRFNHERARRFEQEARVVGGLDHENIVAIYDVGMHEETPYLVFALLQGTTLRECIEKQLTARNAVDYALQIARGLTAAHEAGIVHRDLKPENVFVTDDGCVKILDFGLAKLEAAAPGMSLMTEDGVVLGTAPYMSPEQVRGVPADARSDIFAFGAILYEMLAGRRAFDGATGADTISAILTQTPRALDRKLPVALARIVRRCLEKQPDERFQSVREVATQLEHMSWRSVSPVHALAAGIGALALGAVGWWAVASHTAHPHDADLFETYSTGRVARALTLGSDGMLMVQQTQRGSDGTLFVTGHTTSSFSLGGVEIVAKGTARLGFVFALRGTQLRWHRAIGDSADTQAVALTTIGADAVAVVGVHRGPVDFGNGVRLPDRYPTGDRDCYIVVFGASDGVARWAQSCGATKLAHPRAVVADRDGNVYVTGEYAGEATFGGTTVHRTVGEGVGGFVASYGRDGALRWATAASDVGKLARCFGLAEHDGEVWFTGLIAGRMRIGDVELTGDDAGDAMVGVLDAATGAPRWIRTLAGPGAQRVLSVAVGPAGEIVIGGLFSGTTELVRGQPVTAAGEQDGFVALLDRDGNAVRAWTGGGAGTDSIVGVAFGPRGIVAAGTFEGHFTMGAFSIESRGSYDGYVVEIDPDGPIRSLLGFGGRTAEDRPRSIAIDADGTIRMAGKCRLDAQLEGHPMHCRGVTGGFIAELRPSP